jgi:multisubunit Na+/H+ antiporter MnhB subunit
MALAYRRVRMRSRHHPWRIVAACGVLGLLLAVTVLGGAAQGLVGVLSVVAVLFAAARGLDSPDVQNHERHVQKDAFERPPRAPPPADK